MRKNNKFQNIINGIRGAKFRRSNRHILQFLRYGWLRNITSTLFTRREKELKNCCVGQVTQTDAETVNSLGTWESHRRRSFSFFDVSMQAICYLMVVSELYFITLLLKYWSAQFPAVYYTGISFAKMCRITLTVYLRMSDWRCARQEVDISPPHHFHLLAGYIWKIFVTTAKRSYKICDLSAA